MTGAMRCKACQTWVYVGKPCPKCMVLARPDVPTLAEAMEEVPWISASTAPDDAAEVISEWMVRHLIDTEADEAGITTRRSAAAVSYAHCALAECRERGLL